MTDIELSSLAAPSDDTVRATLEMYERDLCAAVRVPMKATGAWAGEFTADAGVYVVWGKAARRSTSARPPAFPRGWRTSAGP